VVDQHLLVLASPLPSGTDSTVPSPELCLRPLNSDPASMNSSSPANVVIVPDGLAHIQLRCIGIAGAVCIRPAIAEHLLDWAATFQELAMTSNVAPMATPPRFVLSVASRQASVLASHAVGENSSEKVALSHFIRKLPVAKVCACVETLVYSSALLSQFQSIDLSQVKVVVCAPRVMNGAGGDSGAQNDPAVASNVPTIGSAHAVTKKDGNSDTPNSSRPTPSFAIRFTHNVAGNVRLHVLIAGSHIFGSPFPLTVGAGDAHGASCLVSGIGSTIAMPGQVNELTLTVCDEVGNTLRQGGHAVEARVLGKGARMAGPVDDLRNGMYTVRYFAESVGPSGGSGNAEIPIAIDVSVNGQVVKGSPFIPVLAVDGAPLRQALARAGGLENAGITRFSSFQEADGTPRGIW
jgi:hypothetical protein